MLSVSIAAFGAVRAAAYAPGYPQLHAAPSCREAARSFCAHGIVAFATLGGWRSSMQLCSGEVRINC
jgi:hypothetical protein